MASPPAPGIDLLTALLSERADPAVLADPAILDALREIGGRHGVNPLLAYIARDHAPPAEREWCDRVLTRSWARHNQSLLELDYVLSILDGEAIQLLVLKGPLLARRHYQPPFLRKPSLDIDLAVQDKDLKRACDVLAGAGYHPVWPLRESRARSHHIELHHGSRPGVELHFRLSHGRYGIPVEEFFDRADIDRLPNGRQVRILCPADEILHLVLHRAHGRFATLFHLYEIRRIWIAATSAVRHETIRRAAEHHFAGAMALTDVAFRIRWGTPFLPQDAPVPRTWLHWRIDQRLYERFEFLSEPGRALPLAARLERRWIDFQLTDRPLNALRFAAVMARVAWHQLWRRGWRTVEVAGRKDGGAGESL